MIKYITLLATASAFAGPAAAQSLTVSLVGKDPATVHADISHAAKVVCAKAYATDQFAPYEMPGCIAQSIQDAEARVPVLATAPKPPEKLASAR